MIDKEITLPSRPADTTKPNQHQAPHASITTTMSSNYLSEAIITVHQSENVQSLLLASGAPKTQNYNTYIKKWI